MNNSNITTVNSTEEIVRALGTPTLEEVEAMQARSAVGLGMGGLGFRDSELHQYG